MSARTYTRIHNDRDFDYAENVLSKYDAEIIAKIMKVKNRSLFSTPKHREQDILLDYEGAFSMTESRIATVQTAIIAQCVIDSGMVPRETVITDGTASIGGNVFEFAAVFRGVNAVEVDKTRVQMLANNVEHLGLSQKVRVWHGDISEIAMAYNTNLRQDVLFLDPPWSGPDYWKHKRLSLFLNDMSLREVCNMWAGVTRIIALKLPCNFDFAEFFHTGRNQQPLLYQEVKRVIFGYADKAQRISRHVVDNGTGVAKQVRFPKMILLVLRTRPRSCFGDAYQGAPDAKLQARAAY